MIMKQAVLEVKGLTKYFGDVAANKDISLSLDKHEILAIVGENGAGKSTFCKMLTGIYHPDKGSILSFSIFRQHWCSLQQSVGVFM